MSEDNADIFLAIREYLSTIRPQGKTGKSILQPEIGKALKRLGFDIDYEDSRNFLKVGMPVWRNKDDSQIEETSRRRLIDVVVYKSDHPVALIETESDLNDLRETGVTRRKGHYDVFSISKSADGGWFNSYKSLERMAAAAYYYSSNNSSVENLEAIKNLEAIQSDDPSVHNPSHLDLILISGQCRSRDRSIIAKRLKSLNAKLFCAKIR